MDKKRRCRKKAFSNKTIYKNYSNQPIAFFIRNETYKKYTFYFRINNLSLESVSALQCEITFK